MRTPEVQDELVDHLTDNSDGMFLWVTLQSSRLKANMNIARLRKQMMEMPPGLDQVYEADWQRIRSCESFERDRALTILRWVTFAVRPMTAMELLEAIAVVEYEAAFALSEDWPPDPGLDLDVMHQDLLESCRPFLTLRQHDSSTSGSTTVIHLVHFTMKTFLTHKLTVEGGGSTPSVSDQLLARYSVGYLSTGLPWHDESVGAGAAGSHPFLLYAAKHWMSHVDRVSDDAEDVSLLVGEFFSPLNPYWTKWRDFLNYFKKETTLSVAESGIILLQWE